jgi:Na+/proline symporter
MTLHPLDWGVILAYLGFALSVGFWVRERAEGGKESYFLAGRSLPWWWAGTSIAATTFAADTPLAVTGIVADRGLSGNWLWLSMMAVHAAVVVYFAEKWRRSEMLTDAELVSIRYTGRSAEYLRVFRAVLFAVVYNAIILGWVLRAMGKIIDPVFRWDVWFPTVTGHLDRLWPGGTTLGAASEVLTIILLVGIVTLYSSLGGIRGVVFTDLIQFALAMVGSIWLAIAAWEAVGGRAELASSLTNLYGDHQYTDLFPSFTRGWAAALRLGAFTFGAYLVVQSFGTIPSDGGGYLMQRLASCRTHRDARKAAGLFTGLHYLVRVWPWFIVAVAALVLIPIGQEQTALGGAGAPVAGDREMAYPVLLFELLPVGVVGILVASLLAAFMSTVDTHFNWGASYIVNDLYLRVKPDATSNQQIKVARTCVVLFAIASILVALQIDTIEQAWKWVAFIGASLGVPTAARWLWWRVNAISELTAGGVGLGTALLVTLGTSWLYEFQLVVTAAASVGGMLIGIMFGTPTREEQLQSFRDHVQPSGAWPGTNTKQAFRQFGGIVLRVAGLVITIILVLLGGTWLLFHP